MTSGDQATAAFVSRIATVGDGVFVGIGLAVCATTSWMRYFSIQSALRRIQDAPLVPISDLRTLLQEANEREDGGKLVVVRGKVQPNPDSSSGSWIDKGSGGVLISQGSGERAVIVKQIQTCIYNEWRGIFGWRFDLHAILAKSWKEQKSSSMRSVPFVLVEGSHWPNASYINVSLDNSSQPLPLTTVYHQLHPVQNSAYTFLQIVFGHGFPVALLDEEKILPVGKELTAVGICKLREGAFEIKSVPEFPCFLSEKTKDEIEVDLSVDARILFWSGIVLGAVSFSVLSYALVRNWWRWKDRRQRERQAQEIENEDQMQENDSEEDAGEVADGQLCVICLGRRRRSAFVPCGHLVCCPRCAISVELDSSPKCPVCRQTIRSSIRIYGS